MCERMSVNKINRKNFVYNVRSRSIQKNDYITGDDFWWKIMGKNSGREWMFCDTLKNRVHEAVETKCVPLNKTLVQLQKFDLIENHHSIIIIIITIGVVVIVISAVNRFRSLSFSDVKVFIAFNGIHWSVLELEFRSIWQKRSQIAK